MKKKLILIGLLILIIGACLMPTVVLASDGTIIDVNAWSEWIDKYIMPLGFAVVSSGGAIITSLVKLTTFLNTYKGDVKHTMATLKSYFFGGIINGVEEKGIFNNLEEISAQLNDTINEMPITKMQEDIAENTNILKHEAENISITAKNIVAYTILMDKMFTCMEKLACGQAVGKGTQDEIKAICDEAHTTIFDLTKKSEFKELGEVANEIEKESNII